LKHKAANLVLKDGYSFAKASRSLDIGETALKRWIGLLEGERLGVTPKAKAFTDEQRRIQELEAKVRCLEKGITVTRKGAVP
jgi:transposase